MEFLVIGAGSIGQRHIANLKKLGVEVQAFDTNPNLPNFPLLNVPVWGDWGYVPDNIDNYVICTPPDSHIHYIEKAIEAGAHIFCEKPLSINMKGVEDVVRRAKKKNLVFQVGYNLRFHPRIQMLKRVVAEKEIGNPLFFQAEFGFNLAKWRPIQDWRNSYTAKTGIILDASHELDYARWVFGEVKEVFCVAKTCNPEIQAEDVADIVLKFKDGTLGNIHLDMVQNVYRRSYKVTGSTAVFGIPLNKSDQSYVAEMEQFIECIKGNLPPLVDGVEGMRTLELALACKESAKTGKVVKL